MQPCLTHLWLHRGASERHASLGISVPFRAQSTDCAPTHSPESPRISVQWTDLFGGAQRAAGGPGGDSDGDRGAGPGPLFMTVHIGIKWPESPRIVVNRAPVGIKMALITSDGGARRACSTR